MRISDWSSDVCSSDLTDADVPALIAALRASFGPQCLPINLPSRDGSAVVDCFFQPDGHCDGTDVAAAHQQIIDQEIGRESCRERVWQYVEISVVAVPLKKKLKELIERYKEQEY